MLIAFINVLQEFIYVNVTESHSFSIKLTVDVSSVGRFSFVYFYGTASVYFDTLIEISVISSVGTGGSKVVAIASVLWDGDSPEYVAIDAGS